MNLKNTISKIAPWQATKNISLLSSGKFIFYTTGFLYGIFAARILGASGYGQLTVVMATVYLLSLPFDFKIESTMVKLIGERLKNNEELRVSSILKNSFLIQFVGLFLFGVIFLGFLFLFSEKYTLFRDWSTALGLFGLSELIHRPRKTLITALTGFQKYTAYTISAVFTNVSRDIFPVIFMFTHGITGACFGYLLAELINILFISAFYLRIWGQTIIKNILIGPRNLKKTLTKLFYNTRSNYLASMCKRSLAEILNLILGGYIGTRELGFYRVGLRFKPIFSFLIGPITTYLYPRFIEKWQKESKAEFFYTMRKYFYLTAVSGLLLCLMISVVTPWLLPFLYGQDFLPAIPIVWILLPAILVAKIFSIFENIAFVVSEQRSILNAAFLELITGILLAVLLVYYFGFHGAAWAYAGKIYITSIYKAGFFYKKFGKKWLFPNF